MELFQIGDKVEWTSGNIIARSLVYDDDGKSNKVVVNCFELANKKTRVRVSVVRDLLIKIK